ncbi:uncharacterized protein KY384_005866 [Bacidia gigantensis]|uniref:uncharacterized protein n=1 Tax=Bacidia gigantensis TaxID=2732470 RepID=UPI001D04707E|nr:uncharacterized protein KY384_005866 [Bacidia gigantensis]KAG8529231.1 hypothetical protein KY384_005866 [Bacidia gigantensis]
MAEDGHQHTYISENALLPGQVHTYFGGSEQQIFNAYRHEIEDVTGKDQNTISAKLREIFESAGLKPATQNFQYQAAGNTYKGQNVYAVLRAPRGDATEAVVLTAAWENMDNKLNSYGVTLVLTLGRYFSRWSLWSKDIIILITSDSRAGPQAWVDAYHDEQPSSSVEPLSIKSGALQGAIVIDLANSHRFESIHIVYDGINGQLPNLDLINTAVSVASGQMGIGIVLQRMWHHEDSYLERLETMLRGMANQAVGLSAGSHGSFFPYHVDAITLQTVGDGPQDEMAMGRVVESIFRSLNNLLEHFHQSFFFYLLMQADRFVSIGTYLPSAMLVAMNFSIMAIALWIRSGRPKRPSMASTIPAKGSKTEVEIVQTDGLIAVAPKQSVKVVERHLLIPLVLVFSAHFLGLFPLYLFNNISRDTFDAIFAPFTALSMGLPTVFALRTEGHISNQHHTLTLCFSLLLLGMFLATLATLNFSLSLFVGLLATPLSFIPCLQGEEESDVPRTRKAFYSVVIAVVSPPSVLWVISAISKTGVVDILTQAAFGWTVNGMRTQVIVWCVWWPAWLVSSVLVAI